MNIVPKTSFVLSHRHLLGIEGLSADDIVGLLDLADEYVELNRQIEKKRTLAARAHASSICSSKPRPARRPRSSSPASGSAPT